MGEWFSCSNDNPMIQKNTIISITQSPLSNAKIQPIEVPQQTNAFPSDFRFSPPHVDRRITLTNIIAGQSLTADQHIINTNHTKIRL